VLHERESSAVCPAPPLNIDGRRVGTMAMTMPGSLIRLLPRAAQRQLLGPQRAVYPHGRVVRERYHV